jgi:hypothetical protein
VAASKDIFNGAAFTSRLDSHLQRYFPQVYITDGRIVVFEGPRFPALRIWNLSDPISTGKIEIEHSTKLSLVSYEIDMSKYVVGTIVTFILVLLFMALSDFPIILISLFFILVIFFILLVPCLAIINFSSLIRKTIEATGGRVIGGV